MVPPVGAAGQRSVVMVPAVPQKVRKGEQVPASVLTPAEAGTHEGHGLKPRTSQLCPTFHGLAVRSAVLVPPRPAAQFDHDKSHPVQRVTLCKECSVTGCHPFLPEREPQCWARS